MTDFRIEVLRGNLVESVHRVSVAVTDPTGRLVAEAGDPDLATYWRSAAKPFQAMPLVEDGVAAAFLLGDEELALACASHSSEAKHLHVTDHFLAKIGCLEEDLACGPHPPLGVSVARQVREEGIALTPRWSNCSGKHSGMLALARHHGWPVSGYTSPDHPVQQRLLRSVSEWTGLAPEAIGLGIDGCTTVSYHLPLRAMARAWARFGTAQADAPTTLRRAMLTHPDLVAGWNRYDTDVMRALPGRILVKVGAEGVYCAALLEEGLGVALKVEDGDMRTCPLALAGVLEAMVGDIYPGGTLASYSELPVTNTRDAVVGTIRPAGTLRFCAP